MYQARKSRNLCSLISGAACVPQRNKGAHLACPPNSYRVLQLLYTLLNIKGLIPIYKQIFLWAWQLHTAWLTFYIIKFQCKAVVWWRVFWWVFYKFGLGFFEGSYFLCVGFGFFDDASENVKRKHKNLHYNEKRTIMMILNMRKKTNLLGGRSLKLYYFRLLASLC